jgi:anti-anti-sigma regulatory factor
MTKQVAVKPSFDDSLTSLRGELDDTRSRVRTCSLRMIVTYSGPRMTQKCGTLPFIDSFVVISFIS